MGASRKKSLGGENPPRLDLQLVQSGVCRPVSMGAGGSSYPRSG